MKLQFGATSSKEALGYCDADWGGDLEYWKQLENKQKMEDSRFMKWNNCIN
jgi:hypothetical protein